MTKGECFGSTHARHFVRTFLSFWCFSRVASQVGRRKSHPPSPDVDPQVGIRGGDWTTSVGSNSPAVLLGGWEKKEEDGFGGKEEGKSKREKVVEGTRE